MSLPESLPEVTPDFDGPVMIEVNPPYRAIYGGRFFATTDGECTNDSAEAEEWSARQWAEEDDVFQRPNAAEEVRIVSAALTKGATRSGPALRIARAPGYTGPLPAYATAGAAGLDLHARGGGQIAPGESFIIPTGIMVEIPFGYEGQVRGRSSLAGFGVACHLGTIDSDYRGEVCVILTHASHDGRPRGIGDGDRIAQLVIAPVARCEVVEVAAVDLTPTVRGAGGFGSTGT